MNEETLYSLALTRVPGIGVVGANSLLHKVGSATILFKERTRLKDIVPDISTRIIEALNCPAAVSFAEAELNFAEKKGILALSQKDEAYPSRLRDCHDAPVVLFHKGNANFNCRHTINIVGTRRATDYGKSVCQRMIADLKEIVSDVLVISGLAYGIDIHAHRASLQYGLDTVGVLAHGLDRIYPSIHRRTAVEMLQHGGLLTEYPTGTNPDPQNFVQRNRIVAGMSDATIVVESAAKGGALITADIADSYGRDCFAFPGRIGDDYSIGCNKLISSNKATLITSAADLVEVLGWSAKKIVKKAVQRELFPDLSDDEMKICKKLRKSTNGVQINTLVVETNIPINKITGLLFELEMKGVIRALAGGVYVLL